jgi:Tol biopolymer transport system component
MNGERQRVPGGYGLVVGVVITLLAGCSPPASRAPTTLGATATATASALPAPTRSPNPTPLSAYAGPCDPGTLPEGRIVFTVGNGQANGIAVVNVDGSRFRVVVEAKDTPGQPHGGTEGPSWIAPGRIMFDSNRNGGPDDWHIFTVDESGGKPTQVTKGADGIEYHGDLAPDGSFIVFAKAVADPDVVFLDAGLFVADPDGRHERQLTHVPPGGVDEWPAISPDGKRVAFGRHIGPDGGLKIVDIDGSRMTTIMPAEMQSIRPRWSSDGTRIAFSDNADRFLEKSANVWVVNADGTGLRPLTDESGGDRGGQAFLPTWSPDDAYLLFIHQRRGSGINDLAVMPSAGGPICTLWPGKGDLGAWESDWAPAAAPQT